MDFTAFHLLRPLLLRCRAEGWEVEFACADGPGARNLINEGFRYRPVPMTRGLSPLRQSMAVAALVRSLRADPPDLVHTHTPVGGTVGRLAAVLAGCSPLVHTFHGLPLRGERPTTVESAFLALERVLSRRTTYFFSQATGDVARAVSLGIARHEDTLVIGNGVDIGRFTPDPVIRAQIREELGIPHEAFVVLVVARLVREKGLLELADAAARLADVGNLHVVIVGSALSSDRTSVEPELARHAVRQKLAERWHPLGYRSDVGSVLKGADVFALPTYREGLPRSVIEAMATALPAVVTDIAACRELVTDGENGLVVPVGDVSALEHAIRRLAADTAMRRAMSANALRRARRDHDERDVLERQIVALSGIVTE